MLDPQSEQIREVYALFGLAIHNAQSLERELAMVVATTETSERFTAWDYDDLLAGNFDSTFGALVKEFSRVAAAKDQSLLSELEKAVEERNALVHRYFWNRAVQFNSMDGRAQMLEELTNVSAHFDSLDRKLSVRTRAFMQAKGVGQEELQRQFAKLMSGMESPHDPKRIRNAVVITGACEWRVADSVKCAIMFTSDAGNLVLGRTGLCLGPQRIPLEHMNPKPEFAKALPATVNPKPKQAAPWNYVLPLANGYELRVRPDEVNGRQVVRFGLRVKSPKVKR